MAYVHLNCLNGWRAASVNPRSFSTCDACGYTYRTQRTAIAVALQSKEAVWGLASLLLALLVLLAAYLPGNAEQYFYALTDWNPRHEGFIVPSLARVPPRGLQDLQLRLVKWRPWCDRMVAGLLLPALLGLGHLVVKKCYSGVDIADSIFMVLSISQFFTLGGISPALLFLCIVYFWANLVGVITPIAKAALMHFGEIILEAR